MKPTTEFMEVLCKLYLIFIESHESPKKAMELAVDSTNKEFGTTYEYSEVVSTIYDLE